MCCWQYFLGRSLGPRGAHLLSRDPLRRYACNQLNADKGGVDGDLRRNGLRGMVWGVRNFRGLRSAASYE